MSDMSLIRRENLNAICLRQGWVSRKNASAGSPSELMGRLGRSSSFWSDRLNGAKPIGAELAREIEESLNLPKYSLDGDAELSDFIQVAHLSVEVGAGPGRTNSVVEELSAFQFRRDFLRSAGVSPLNAAIVNVVGTSMEPTIRDGSALLLNRSDKEPRNGSIYAFSWDGDMLVKRFQIVNHVWHAVSDNADKDEHPDIIIDGKTEALIQGRAIWVCSKL
ncbi:S24 family peptidase [Pantoea sp. 18069]|uniref:S24 family peptidase n=1 Tax=Pantoea sp. 18069 TaxID=2681415 RepID=UPI00190F4A95|nr:S24 family peptidase [Pantoea sp. 18069]